MSNVVSSSEVIQRMVLKDVDNVRSTIDSSLITAHAVVEGLLNTTFDPAARIDTFFLAEKFPTPQDNLLCCRLLQGFVHPGTLSVSSGNSRNVLTTNLGGADYVLDDVKGTLKVEYSFLNTWISVSYTAGIDGNYQAPVWLKEAIMAYLPHLLAQASDSFDAKAIAAANETSRLAFASTAKIVDPYLRHSSFQYLPVSSAKQ